RRSGLVRDLPGTGSKTCNESYALRGRCAAHRSRRNLRKLPRPSGRSGVRPDNSAVPQQSPDRRSGLVRDLPGTGSKTCTSGGSETISGRCRPPTANGLLPKSL
ncbi:hypothetical protein GIV19_20975, partial [Pseudomonas syringae]|nr:hypothetical protein [Pseudomonas syringae]